MKKFKTDMCSCGDTNQQQLLIWLGTKSEKKGRPVAKKIVKKINLYTSGPNIQAEPLP